MRKRCRILAAMVALIVFVALTGCASTETLQADEPEITEVPVILSTPEVTVTPPSTPDATAVATPEATPEPDIPQVMAGISPTTGREWTGEYKPVCVMIENSAAARPHSGLEAADWVYECTVEGAITRFMAVFSDNMPPKVGPVRSCRIYYVDLQQEWDALLVHFGGPVKGTGTVSVYEKFERVNVKQRLDGISGHASITRDSARAAPHNAYVDLTKAQPAYNYTPAVVHANFFDAEYEYPSAAAVTKIEIPYPAANNKVRYVWDADKNAFARFLGSAPFTDRESGNQIFVTNVIVQYANQVAMGTREGHINVELIGSGKAEVYLRGMKLEATWEKADITSRTIYRDLAGKELRFAPGNTWVQYVPLEMAVTSE